MAPLFARRERSLLSKVLSVPSVRQVPGLIVVPDAVSASEERQLLSLVDTSSARWTQRRTRLTKNYGPYYTYIERDTPEGRFRYTDGTIRYTDLPPFLSDVLLPILRRAVPTKLLDFEPNQVHVALYDNERDGKIHMHNDNKMGTLGPYIVGMSLVAGADMTFVRPADGRKRVVALPRRCVYVLSGPAHNEWRHGILTGQTKGRYRVSFTLRDVRKLAVEQGVHVRKSSHMPTEKHIEAQREKDRRRKEMMREKERNGNVRGQSVEGGDQEEEEGEGRRNQVANNASPLSSATSMAVAVDPMAHIKLANLVKEENGGVRG